MGEPEASAPLVASRPAVPLRALPAGARLAGADRGRVVAVAAVVVLHAVAPLLNGEGPAWGAGNAVDSALRWCVPLLFMLSGSLLFERAALPRRFLVDRARKLAAPLVLWSAFYLYWPLVLGRTPPGVGLAPALLAGPTYYHLWFLYALAGVYLLAPLLHAARRPYLIGLWLAWASLAPLVERLAGIELHFSAGATDGALDLAGYFVLGAALRDVRLRSRRRRGAAVLAFLIGWALTALGTVALTRQRGAFDPTLYEYASPGVLAMSVSLFLLNASPARRLWRSLAPLAFGAYLVHAALLDVAKRLELGAAPAALTVLPASFALAALLRRLPYAGRWLVA